MRPHRWQPTRLARPWDSPGKNSGVGCHFLLQCMKVKSESEVAQSCPTLSDPRDCSLPGSSAHGIFQARVLEWGAIAFSNTPSYNNNYNISITYAATLETPSTILSTLHSFNPFKASLIAQLVKNPPAMRETWVQSLGWEDPLEKEMAIYSSTIACKIPWAEDPGRLQSMGLQRVRHD